MVSAIKTFPRLESYGPYHEFSFREQLANIHCNQLGCFDVQNICNTIMNRRDRLSYYRLMEALSHVSKTAKSIADHPFRWSDDDTRLEEVQLVAAQVKGDWAHEYVLRLAKIMDS
jgi:hypothetical protein